VTHYRSAFHRSVVPIVLVIAGALGCWRSSSPPGPASVQVTDITLGRSLAPDGTIVSDARTNLFWTSDTFYVSVATEGAAAATGGAAPDATVKARWTDADGKVVNESEKTISASGPAVTAFEAASPEADHRWKPGDYKVEILVDGVSAGTKDLNAR